MPGQLNEGYERDGERVFGNSENPLAFESARDEEMKRKKQKSMKRYIPIYLLAAPGLAYLFINNYLPMFGMIIAFKKVDFRKGILKSDFIGLKNFEYLFKTKDAWVITRNTILYNLAFIFFVLIFAVAFAIIINELKQRRMSKFYQTVILLPHMISMVIVSYLVFAFLSNENGFINNQILLKLGMEKISWYTEPKYWPFILVFVHVWKSVGYSSIVYLAAVVGIDQELYEAASLDGASTMQRIRYITMPIIKPVMIMMVLLSVGRIFYSDFGLFYQVPQNSGMLYSTTNVIDTYVYRALMQLGDIGMSSAAGVYQSLVGFVLVLSANLIVRRIDKESALF